MRPEWHRRLEETGAAILVVAGILAGVSAADAQTRLEVSPFAGYHFAGDLYHTYFNNQPVHVQLTNALTWGARLTARQSRGGLELSYTRTSSDIRLERVLPGQPRDKMGRLDLDKYDVNLLIYQPSGNPRVTPFGVIGFGWAVTHPEVDPLFLGDTGSNPESHALFSFNFGLGGQFELTPKVGLRLDGRWRITDTALSTSDGFWCDPWGYCYSYASDWYNSGELTGGLTYAFR